MSLVKQKLKSLYRAIPFKPSMFHALRPIVNGREGIYKHLYFKGDIVVPIDENHRFQMHHFGFELENKLFWAGLANGWEKTSTALWIRLVKDAAVILDIGANTGIYSLIAKSVNPAAEVFAFEPVERIYEKLEYNVALNRYDIVCIKSAVSNKDGEAVFYDPGSDHIYSVSVNKNVADETTPVVPITIKTVRLDTFVRQRRIEKVDLVKIDVEYHEPEVLEGFGEYLEIHRPTMLVEVLNDEIGARVERIVDGKGYLYFNLDENTDSIRRVDTIVKSDFYNYLICDPAKASHLGLH